jgi:hypothetical protein
MKRYMTVVRSVENWLELVAQWYNTYPGACTIKRFTAVILINFVKNESVCLWQAFQA